MSLIRNYSNMDTKNTKVNTELSISDQIVLIENTLNELSKCNNLSDMLKKYTDTNTNINDLLTSLNQIKSDIDNFKPVSDDISQEQFESYMKSINDNMNELSSNDMNINDYFSKYKIILEKTTSCITYLNNKKMSIINCD